MRHLLATTALLVAAESSASSWTTTLTSENGGTHTRVSWEIDNYSITWDGPSASITLMTFGGTAAAGTPNQLALNALPAITDYTVNPGIVYTNLTRGGDFSVNLLRLALFNGGGEGVAVVRIGNLAGLPVETNDVVSVGGNLSGSFTIDLPFSTFNEGSWDTTGDGSRTLVIGSTPIPEPSTYGLILGGLALAGAAVRRRMKKQAA
jgi:hypothetical protein